MQRRTLLQGMFAVPVAAALGCKNKIDTQPPAIAKPGTLKVFLHGPFALVLDSKNPQRIKAFIPFDEEGLHEFRFPTPNHRVSGEGGAGHRNHYEFTLREDNLEISGKGPHIDAGFADFRLHAHEWKWEPEEYFVSLDLPLPDIITFVPTATVPVEFVDGRLGMMPLDHVLEYTVRDFANIANVRLDSPQLGKQHASPPLTCHDMFDQYKKAMGKDQDKEKDEDEDKGKNHGKGQSNSRQHLDAEFKRCEQSETGVFLLGVGLSTNNLSVAGKTHALNFFNNKLLGSFPNSPEHDKLKLQDLDVGPCTTSTEVFGPTLVPAVERYPVPTPHFRQIASIDDCRVGGLIATTS